MCRIAWELMIRRLREPDLSIQSVELPAHLLVRESSEAV